MQKILYMDKLYIGHRKRLKERFLKAPNSLQKYELLEMMLFWSAPRRDVKDLAKSILAEFGCFNNLLNVSKERLDEIPGLGDAFYSNLQLIKVILSTVLSEEIEDKPLLGSWNALINYLQFTQGSLATEQLRILFLNSKNILIADELQETGTVDQTPVYPREVIKRCLLHEASAIIIVHNHPSGVTTPSRMDIELTKRIIEACKAVNVSVHDHIIVSKSDFYSFKNHMLI
jgi:DNA repair protein RadC